MALFTKWLTLFLSIFFFARVTFAGAQAPSFSQKKIVINKVVLKVEVAETHEQHNYGLMNRQKQPENLGMMFVFDEPEIRSFWMKNTFIDLSIGYFDQNRVLFQILDMKATSLMQKDIPSYVSSGPAQFALEVTKGWFQRHGIKPGDKFDWR